MKANKWEIENFASGGFCKDIIRKSELLGFDQATANVAGRSYLEYRNNHRVIFDDSDLSSMLWEKIKNDSRLDNPGWKTLGLNERFKVYKYIDSENHYFAPHFDASYERVPLVEQSWVTLLIYLNDDFEVGETSCQNGDIVPVTGKAALFTQHNVLHEALQVTKGIKYVLRTDVMYRKE